MINDNRISKLNDKDLDKDKDYILYWMQGAQRIEYNHALAHAIDLSNRLNKGLVVYCCLVNDFPEANIRHYNFMLEGLVEIQEKMKELGINFVLEKNSMVEGVLSYSKNACIIITDKGYLNIQKYWRKKLSEEVNVSVLEISTNTIVPVDIASEKEEYAAYTIRRKINMFLDEYMKKIKIGKLNNKKIYFESPVNLKNKKSIKSILKSMDLDNSVNITSYYKGGYSEAKKLLKEFISKKLNNYSEYSNNPEKDYTSHLSPYLHFGQISPLEIAMYIKESNKDQKSKEDFLEQLIIRRELAFNFVYFNEDYNKSLESILSNWCIKTLKEHIDDKRKYNYSIETFESAKTHDIYWNAAQKELIATGLMHNYMRMYWGKKVIEWTDSYSNAFDILKYLNNKYALDGRDPNSFTGIAWCFGKHDRAWKERDIFGKIRYMNSNGLERKFNIKEYVKKINEIS